MQQKHSVSKEQQRAMNIVWTAAGDYSFTPAFLSFFQNGTPDFYMNSIIGYVRKWYEPEIINRLFDLAGRSFFHETLDGLLWVALENCAYEKEVKQRPVLEELRLEHARLFFEQEQFRSRQQWMAQNSLVYALQAARCRLILGKEASLLNPWERNLFRDLQYSGNMNTQEIYDQSLLIFRKYFFFRESLAKPSFFQKLRSSFQRRMLRHLPSKTVRTEYLLTGVSPFRTGGRLTIREGGIGKKQFSSPEDFSYIEGCFGRSIYTDAENEAIEQSLCTLAHRNCHLHFTDGELSSVPDTDPLVEKVRSDAHRQYQQNLAHYRSRRVFYRNSILHLTEQIKNALLVYPQSLPLPARSGRFCPGLIWRGLYLNDPRVFTDTLKENSVDFSVDLMLDASASRLEYQELISCQGYVIAKSLQKCGIPVQVYSYLSIRGFTVMNRFLQYSDGISGDCRSLFRYFAAGWNRDGLALRGAGELMHSSPARNKILIILTDASPNDDHRIPLGSPGASHVSRDYSGQAGIDDTAREVRALRKAGIHVCAILTGEDGDAAAAKNIFGNDFVRIEKIEHFSRAAGLLIQKQIQKLNMAPVYTDASSNLL